MSTKTDVTGDINVMTERLQTITTWVYRMDATMTMTGDHKKMSVDDAIVQTTHKENGVSRINRDEHDHQLLRVALESRVGSTGPVTHASGCLINISHCQIAQPNVNVDSSLQVRHGQLKQFEELYPDIYFDGCIRCYLDSRLTNKLNC